MWEPPFVCCMLDSILMLRPLRCKRLGDSMQGQLDAVITLNAALQVNMSTSAALIEQQAIALDALEAELLFRTSSGDASLSSLSSNESALATRVSALESLSGSSLLWHPQLLISRGVSLQWRTSMPPSHR
jgi:hypothetical protein